MKKYVFGIDIGGTTIKMGLFKSEGKLDEMWEIQTRKQDGGSLILIDIANEISNKLNEKGILKEEIEGIGLGVPGPVSDDGTVFKCVNLGWGIINVEKKLEELTGLKVKAGNDANVAALGEMWKGGGKGYKNVVMVTLGTGVGGGIIIDGKIVSGANGAGGEIGHIHISDNESETCGCGKRGCLEQYASATGIVKYANKLMSEVYTPSTLRRLEYISAKAIFEGAEEGDLLSLEVVEFFAKQLGKALSYITCVCDPEVIVIGGGVSKAGEIIINTVSKYYKQYAFHASRNTKFALAELGNEAGIFGGAKLIIQ